MNKIQPSDILIKACKIEAIRHFDKAIREAGGGVGYEKFKHMTLEDFMDVISRNGVRFSFSREWHMDRLNPSIELFTEAVNEIISESK